MKKLTQLKDRVMGLGMIGFGVLAVFLIIFPATTVSAIYQYGTVDTTTATVGKTERVCETDSACRWMVLTDQGAMLNTDTLFHLKFSSTDVQANLVEGEEYTFTHYGWRIPFLSMYPNIISVE